VAYNPCGVNDASRVLTLEVLKNLFWRGESLLGPAVFAAKCSVITWYPTNDWWYGPAVLWTLLGDPALRVRHGASTAIEDGERQGSLEARFEVRAGLARPAATVNYSLPEPARVKLVLLREDGGEVGTIFDGFENAGEHRVDIKTRLAAGVYFVRLDAASAGRPVAAKLTVLP
jgi:hypothetical protein